LNGDSKVFLKRVVIQNYKSISSCSVSLSRLSFLVGPNGSGKSNFLDSIRFVRDALRTSLENAIRDRGGIKEVRRRSGGHPTHFGIRLDFDLASKFTGHYAFKIAARRDGGFEIQQEECTVSSSDGKKSFFSTYKGTVKSSVPNPPSASEDSLFLVRMSGVPEFEAVLNDLSHMGFYNINPDAIREWQPPDSGDLLSRDGSNISSVVERIERESPADKQIIEDYLSKVVPSVHAVSRVEVGPRETVEFRQDVAGAKHPWRFFAAYMSDGTLRALGILVALFQSSEGKPISLVGVEEPEVALHPAAVGIVLEALKHSSERSQVIVTSHSPDLLDDPQLNTDQILAVVSEGNVTQIAPLDEASRQVLEERLFTAGELLRLNQLSLDIELFDSETYNSQLDLFDPGKN
jgi:predicted ATPase